MVKKNTFSPRASAHSRGDRMKDVYCRHNAPQFVKQDSEAAANKEHIYGGRRHKTASQASERSQSVLNNRQRCQAVRIWGNLISGGR